jgi:streptogramin lyase
VGFTNNILASASDEDGTYLQNDLVVASANNDMINWYTHDWVTNIAVVRAPGQSGPDAGLLYPADPTVGPDGNVYVAGWDSGNITRYDPTTGAFIDEFASGGTEAAGIAFGPDGNLYVADTATSEVRRYDGTTGAFIDAFVTAGLGGLDQADGLTFGPDGNLYVGDYWNANVLRYDGTTGAFIDEFVTANSGGLDDPEDLAFGPDGNLYVASDKDHNVLRFDGTTGAFIDVFVAAHSGGLDNPMGIVFGPDGNLYVSSWKDDNVLRYDGTTGAFIDEYVTTGLGGLNIADYHDFIPGHQILVVEATTADADGPYAIAEGDSVALDGSGSSDPEGDPLTYNWDLNNDLVYGDVTGETPTVDWATLVSFGIDDDGTYPIGLEVDDGNGNTDTDSSTIVVSNTPPTLSTTGAATAGVGTVYTLNLSAVDPGDDTISSWTINWGDGAIVTYAGDPASVTHTYNNVGFTFNILASAIDEDATYFQNDLVISSTGDDRVNWYTHDWSTDIAAVRAPGQSGPDAGIDWPVDPIIGPDGLVYIGGWISDNVIRYDPTTGAYVDEFISAGTGGLSGACGMGFGPDGNLYVTSFYTDEILRYDGTTGAFIDDFVSAGSGGMEEPSALVFGPDGNLYVSDYVDGPAHNAVFRYDGITGAFIDKFVASGSGGLNYPEDLAFGPDGNLYVVSEETNNVLRYDGTTGAFIDEFIPQGSGPSELGWPHGAQFGPDGNFYVSSFSDSSVKQYDGTTGAFIDNYVTDGLGGLLEPNLFNFIPGHQVLIVP